MIKFLQNGFFLSIHATFCIKEDWGIPNENVGSARAQWLHFEWKFIAHRSLCCLTLLLFGDVSNALSGILVPLAAAVFAGLRKQIRELEELNSNYARLLTTAGIPLTSGPEEIWDHKPKKYSVKHSPEKQRALLACTEVKTALQSCQQPPAVSSPSSRAESVRAASNCAVAPAAPMTQREVAPGCTLVTQALPSAPVMSTAQPPAVTVFQQQHPLTAMTAPAAAMSQPILVFNDQGVPVLQNVVTFQNTSIILNPQGHAMAARDDFAVTHQQQHAPPALGGLLHCDPKLKEAKLCSVQPAVHNATFLPGAGMVMNQPILSLGGGATTMIASQNTTTQQVPSAFLLPSGQIIPVVTQSQVVSAPMAVAPHPGQVVCANTCGAVAGLGKVVSCETSRTLGVREQGLAVHTVQQSRATTATVCNGSSTSASSHHAGCKRQQHLSGSQHASSSSHSTKGNTLPDSSRPKQTCNHSTSKQPLCSIRPKPTAQAPDSSQSRTSCQRKGAKKLSRASPEVPAKKARTDGARPQEEHVASTSSGSPPDPVAPSQGLESVSSTSSKGTPPLATDILARATESIFSTSGLGELPPATGNRSEEKLAPPVTRSLPTSVSSMPVERADSLAAVVTAATALESSSVALLPERCPGMATSAEPVCSSEVLQTSSTSGQGSRIQDVFQDQVTTIQMDAETSSTMRLTRDGQEVSPKEGGDPVETGRTERSELSSLSLHSIVMEENIDISPSVSSTTFTETFVSVGANSGHGSSIPQVPAKVSDCTSSMLCQLTPPHGKSSEDNNKPFVSSTDSLTSDQELPLILSIPEDDGHGSLNSNSNPGLSFPSLSPGDQLDQELGSNHANKNVENASSLPPFSLTPPAPTLSVSTVQAPASSSLNKKKNSSEAASDTYAYITSEAYPGVRDGPPELHAIGNSGSKQDCHHASRSPQLQSLPSTKLLTETSCHSFASNAQTTIPMPTRGLQFPPAPAQLHNSQSALPGFASAQGFATSKEPDVLPSLVNGGKPPPSPCRMTRDVNRSTTPNKTLSSQFPVSINPYMATTSFPFPRPDQYTSGTLPPSLTNSSSMQSSNSSSLSCYSAEALIGTQNFLPSSYRVAPPCSQLPTTQMMSCRQSSRPQISYSAESLIQSQGSSSSSSSTTTKKDSLGSSKEASFSNQVGFANRLPCPQSQMTTHSHQRLSSTTVQQSQQAAVSNLDKRTPLVSTASALSANSTYQMPRNLAGTPARYPLHPYHHTKDHFPSLHTSPQTSQSTLHGHHLHTESASSQNVFQHQSYTYPNFSLGHRSPSFSTCSSRSDTVAPPTSRAPPSCLQAASSPRQSHFGMQTPLANSQQQGCLFPSSAGASILPPLTTEFGPQCSGPLAPPPPVFGNLPQHCGQPPHLMNNLIPGPFATTGGAICGAPLPPPIADVEKHGRRDKSSMLITSEVHCSETDKQQPKSKSKKSKPSNPLQNTAATIPYFPDFRRNESQSHSLLQLPPPPSAVAAASAQKAPHSSTLSWQHQQLPKPGHGGLEADCGTHGTTSAYNPLFRPQSQNSINLNLNASMGGGAHASAVGPSFSHNHSPLQRNSQQSLTASTVHTTTCAPSSQAHYTNCSVATSHHVPNFNLSNIFPDIGMGEQGRSSSSSAAHFYPSSRVLHNSFNHILPPPPPPPHNNFVSSGHHAPSFSNVIPPLTFPMHER